MEEQKHITWKELKQFVNSVPEEFLNEKVGMIVEDLTITRINKPFFQNGDYYSNKQDPDDCGTLEELMKLHGDDFNENDYTLNFKIGTPFLWTGQI